TCAVFAGIVPDADEIRGVGAASDSMPQVIAQPLDLPPLGRRGKVRAGGDQWQAGAWRFAGKRECETTVGVDDGIVSIANRSDDPFLSGSGGIRSLFKLAACKAGRIDNACRFGVTPCRIAEKPVSSRR